MQVRLQRIWFRKVSAKKLVTNNTYIVEDSFLNKAPFGEKGKRPWKSIVLYCGFYFFLTISTSSPTNIAITGGNYAPFSLKIRF